MSKRKNVLVADHTIRVDVYDASVGVFRTRKGLKRAMRDIGFDVTARACDGMAVTGCNRHGAHYAVYLKASASASTVAHEMVHVAMFILDNVGVTVDGDNHEALCYLVGHLVEEYGRL